METKKQVVLGLGRKKFTFSRAQKHVIVQEYLTGVLSKREIWEKYTGEKQEHGQILRWMREFGYENQTLLSNTSNFEEITAHMKKKTSSFLNNQTADALEDTDALKRRVALLEYKLKEEQAKAAAFSTMIDIAEKELKISIRKK
jgi:hypothetical protein